MSVPTSLKGQVLTDEEFGWSAPYNLSITSATINHTLDKKATKIANTIYGSIQGISTFLMTALDRRGYVDNTY